MRHFFHSTAAVTDLVSTLPSSHAITLRISRCIQESDVRGEEEEENEE